MTDIHVKKAGRPRKYFTDEEKKEYRKKYNDMRGPRKLIHKTCDICNKTLCSQNMNTHKLTKEHMYLARIKELNNQLEIRG